MKQLEIYTSIHDMPTKNFFKCRAGELKYMFKEYNKVGRKYKITKEIIEVWDSINEVWDLKLGDFQSLEARAKYARVMTIRKEIVELETFITLLAIKPHDKDCIETVKKMRFNYDPDNAELSLRQMQGEAKNMKHLASSIINEINNKNKPVDGSKIDDELQPYALIGAIETMKNGMAIDTSRVVVAQFIVYVNEYRDYIKEQKKQALKYKK